MNLLKNVFLQKVEVITMKNLKTVILAAVFLAVLQFSTASADSFDNFQAALVSGQYTIRYENITPPSRQITMKERKAIQNGKLLGESAYMMYITVSGVISGDGVNRYVETFSTQNDGLKYATCSLQRGEEIFQFNRIEHKNKIQYVGNVGKGKVQAMPLQSGLMTAYSFGDNAAVNKVLNAALPNSEKIAGAITYRKIKSGFLKNGIEYADLKAVNPPAGVIFDAIRYYFQDGKLVKIVAGQYFGSGTNLDSVRTIIKVTDFQNSADSTLLQLPKELKDVTKREKSKKA